MTLGDDLIGAVGTPFDQGGMIANVARSIAQAQRFVLRDDVARACGELCYSRPSTLNAALPLCRMPYETMWIENSGGLGRDVPGETRNKPLRQGVLLEAADASGQIGIMTLAWVHRAIPGHEDILHSRSPCVCPFAIYFDWTPDGDVKANVRAVHAGALKHYNNHPVLDGIFKFVAARHRDDLNYAWAMEAMRKTPAIAKYADDPKEVEAIVEGGHHMTIGVSPHAMTFICEMLKLAGNSKDTVKYFLENWLADVAGEGPFAECFIAMLNSKNPVIEQQPTDFVRLNKSRVKAGKRPFLDHIETRLTLSRSQARYAHAAGMTRDEARQHIVRGHFKIRMNKRTGTGGVFWWSPHLRGDPRHPVERKEYEVV